MKTILFTLVCSLACFSSFGQEKKLSKKESKAIMNELFKQDNSLTTARNSACLCIDSISLSAKSREDITKEITKCIDEQVMIYSMSKQIFATMKSNKSKHEIFLPDSNSNSYKNEYFEIERALMDSCPSMKNTIANDNKENRFSKSNNQLAMEFYEAGNVEFANENYINAIAEYKKALALDPDFAFCWDNLGLSNRKLGRYEEALEAYQHSLQVDPNGRLPLQNIPVVYEFQEKWDDAINAYQIYSQKYPNDPEGYYGIGRIFAMKGEYENALINLCKSYNLYIEQKSPYRADAEKMINLLYHNLKEAKKEKRFYEILEELHIKTENKK